MLSTLTRSLVLTSLAFISTGAFPSQDAAPSTLMAPPVKTTLAAPIYVAGYSVRTTGAAEATGLGEIVKLWTRFFTDGLADGIPHRSNQSLMVVYSDYPSDPGGEFTYLLGSQVDTVEGLPKDMVFRKIPAGNYAVITSPRGPLQEVIPNTWKQIATMTPADLGGKRSFVMDYEVYDERAADPGNAIVEFHLGLVPDSAAPAK
jgi:predicted transcriptional regulator YdeE